MSGYIKKIIIRPVKTGSTCLASGGTAGVTDDALPVVKDVVKGGWDTVIISLIIGGTFLLTLLYYFYRLLSPPESTGLLK